MVDVCSVRECERTVLARGYCRKHYKRYMAHGSPTYLVYKQHRKSRTREYKSWQAIKDRCLNPSCSKYKKYGARGIKVCSRWANSFENFYEDMGDCPEGFTIDRIDNRGDYEPRNCRWVSVKENSRNRRSSKLTENDVEEIKRMLNEGFTQEKVARIFGVSRSYPGMIKSGTRWV